MQAIVIDAAGQRGRLETVDQPQPGARDSLVRVTYAGVNPIDWKVRNGDGGAIDRTPFVLGQDFAGVVESVGNDVTDISAGDRVFGVARGYGSYAERTLITQGVGAAPYARIPDGVVDAIAAALPTPALTAYAALEILKVGSGTRLLVAGAVGAVGSAALQIARSRGANITAIVKPEQRDKARALGAARTLDGIQNVDVVETDERYDAILDPISDSETLKKYWAVIRPGGALVTTIHDADVEWFAGHDILATNIVMAQTPQSSTNGLTALGRWVVDGTLHVDFQERDLREAPQILDDMSAGKSRGKIVLRVTSG